MNIIAYPENNAQMEAIKAFMNAFKIKFDIAKEGNTTGPSGLGDDQLEPLTKQQFMQWIEEAEKTPNMTLDAFNDKWEQKKQQLIKHTP